MLFTLLFAGVVAADASASTDAVSVEFQGSSGGFKLFPVGEDKFIQISSDNVEEYDIDGKKVGASFSPAGGSFAPVFTTDSGGTTVYHAIYNNEKQNKNFTMGCMLAQANTTVFDPVANDTVTVRENTLKFSVAIEGWVFKNSNNTLVYSISIKDKTGNKTSEKAGSNATQPKMFNLDDGSIETPLTAVADGEDVAVQVTSSEQGVKQIISFTFPSFTKSLKYDPDVSLNSDGKDVPSSASTTVVSLAALAAAFFMA